MNTTFDSPDALDRFVAEVQAELEGGGFPIAARRLADIRSSAYTTSSEWLGELGAAMKAIRNQRGLSASLKDKVEVILAEARRAWPTS